MERIGACFEPSQLPHDSFFAFIWLLVIVVIASFQYSLATLLDEKKLKWRIALQSILFLQIDEKFTVSNK